MKFSAVNTSKAEKLWHTTGCGAWKRVFQNFPSGVAYDLGVVLGQEHILAGIWKKKFEKVVYDQR